LKSEKSAKKVSGTEREQLMRAALVTSESVDDGTTQFRKTKKASFSSTDVLGPEDTVLIGRPWAAGVVLNWNETFRGAFGILTERAEIAECRIIAELSLEESVLDRITASKEYFRKFKFLLIVRHDWLSAEK
jgi:hypothetical protein